MKGSNWILPILLAANIIVRGNYPYKSKCYEVPAGNAFAWEAGNVYYWPQDQAYPVNPPAIAPIVQCKGKPVRAQKIVFKGANAGRAKGEDKKPHPGQGKAKAQGQAKKK